jgi:hypothetical protein
LIGPLLLPITIVLAAFQEPPSMRFRIGRKWTEFKHGTMRVSPSAPVLSNNSKLRAGVKLFREARISVPHLRVFRLRAFIHYHV